MKYKFLLPLFLLLLIPLVAAEKGVGIMWATQSESVKESQTDCINYSVYNPFSEDANIYLTATGELAPLATDSQAQLVPAGTTHDKALPDSICFKIPKVYSEDCIAGMFCEQKCGEAEKTYTGEVIAAEKTETTATTGGAGSSTKATASVPLTLKVACEPKTRNFTPAIVIGLVLLVLIVLAALRRKKRQY